MKNVIYATACAAALATISFLSNAAPATSAATATPAAKTAENKEMAAVETLLKLKNFKGAYAELEKMASKDHPEAYYQLAQMTEHGIGVKADGAKAIELYKTSAKLGFAPAYHALGMIYGKGLNGVSQDLKQAKQYFDQATALGLKQADVDYGVMLLSQDNPELQRQGLNHLAPYIQSGNHQARYHKALYDLAFGTKQKNEAQAKAGLLDIKALAEAGYVPALMDMGKMLMAGQFFNKDLNEAKKIFTKLNQAQIPEARALLAQVNQELAKSSNQKK